MTVQPRVRMVFDADSCTRCGECFHKCPELRLPLEIAKDEIERLIHGKESKHVLAHCTTCFSCNLLCPHDCKPYQLILERWNDRYRSRGAPPINRLVCPSLNNNVWHLLTVFLTPKEASWTQRWMSQTPKDTILLVGNYIHLLPFVVGDSRLLDRFTPVDLLDHWECGAYLYQLGFLDVAKRVAEKCRQDFAGWDIKTVVPLLDAVHWMLTDVHPNEMKVEHGIEVVNFNEWLLEHLQSREIELAKPVALTVTVHDNCYSKAGDGQYWDTPREILKQVGCEITEMRHVRRDSLCCGFGAGASGESSVRTVFDMLDVASRKLREAEETGADALVSYCGGCMYLLWVARELFDHKMDLYHMVEIVRIAMGERLEYPELHVKRAWDIIAIMTYQLVRSLGMKFFWIREVSIADEGWKQSRFTLLRFMRMLLDVAPVRSIYKRMLRTMLPAMKSKRTF